MSIIASPKDILMRIVMFSLGFILGAFIAIHSVALAISIMHTQYRLGV